MSSPWASYAAGITFRAYQSAALESFESVCAQGGRRFYLVAPPGSGKTLLGLSMAARLEAPALVLSPTTTIAAQWLSRLSEHWVCLDETVERFEPSPRATTDPAAHGFALASLTYQRLSVAGEAGELHDNVRRLYENLLAAGVTTLILDECHHLSRSWGAAVRELMRALGEPFVVGLTATPPDTAQGTHFDLFGRPDHVISLPSVVRSGDLAPYQELCHTVAPSAEEQGSIAASVAAFEELFSECCRSAGDRFSLLHWAEELESDPRAPPERRHERLLELALSQRDLVVAVRRLRKSHGYEPPVELPYTPEFDDAPGLADRLLLAAHYAAEVLLGDPALAHGELASRAAGVLAEWGYRIAPGRVGEKPGRISECIGFSRRKLAGVAEILRSEIRALGDDLRVLIVTDYEFPPAGSRAISCLEVMDLLTRDSELDELDPVLVTGSSLLVDDDLWPRFSELAAASARREGFAFELDPRPERGYVRVLAAGRTPDTAAAVRLATELLERGYSRCIVGTRALLGEGWDCRKLNTLIDLTFVTGAASVNQLRGRSLRLDPDDPVKVANHWDVLCLSACGDRTDLDRIAKRHDRLYGVTDDGQIERGVGHFHASFAHKDPIELYARLADVNQAMHLRAGQRADVRKRWRVGESFRDEEWPVVSFTPARRTRGVSRTRLSRQSEAGEVLISPTRLREHRRSLATSGLLGVAGSSALAMLTSGVLDGGAFWALCSAPALAGLLWTHRTHSRIEASPSAEAELRAIAEILLEAEGGAEGAPRVVERLDGTLRLLWDDVEPARAARLATAMAELLAPVSGQRYLVWEPVCGVSDSAFAALFRPAADLERAFPVPRMFGRRSAAERLLNVWRRRRHPDAALIHTGDDAGRALAARLRGFRTFAGHANLNSVWR